MMSQNDDREKAALWAEVRRVEREHQITKDALGIVKNKLREERMKWEAEHDAPIAERDAVIAERQSLIADRDAVVAERDALRVENARLRSRLSRRPTKQRRPTQKEKVFACLCEGMGSPKDIADKLHVPQKTASRELWKLARSGKATTSGRGAYALPPTDHATVTR